MLKNLVDNWLLISIADFLVWEKKLISETILIQLMQLSHYLTSINVVLVLTKLVVFLYLEWKNIQ